MSNYKHLIQENAWLKQQLAVLEEGMKDMKRKREYLLFKGIPSGKTTPKIMSDFAKKDRAELSNRLVRSRNLANRTVGPDGPFQDAPKSFNKAKQAELIVKLAMGGQVNPVTPQDPITRAERLANVRRMNRENNPKPVKKP